MPGLSAVCGTPSIFKRAILMARKVCRVKAIVAIDPGQPPFIDGNNCYGCLVCMPACPYGAVVA